MQEIQHKDPTCTQMHEDRNYINRINSICPSQQQSGAKGGWPGRICKNNACYGQLFPHLLYPLAPFWPMLRVTDQEHSQKGLDVFSWLSNSRSWALDEGRPGTLPLAAKLHDRLLNLLLQPLACVMKLHALHVLLAWKPPLISPHISGLAH